ncbi:hypothetical protein BDK88_3303 [Natrinema hispanicum]|uniref:Uncharacterized protein n=1 Tax=Natrinema hispanicum TaxID=392421 RepID=A0A482Y7N1_9EURY|nr:hypothetical protein BDK88_3303 [Natrinema hispanicum]
MGNGGPLRRGALKETGLRRANHLLVTLCGLLERESLCASAVCTGQRYVVVHERCPSQQNPPLFLYFNDAERGCDLSRKARLDDIRDEDDKEDRSEEDVRTCGIRRRCIRLEANRK